MRICWIHNSPCWWISAPRRAFLPCLTPQLAARLLPVLLMMFPSALPQVSTVLLLISHRFSCSSPCTWPWKTHGPMQPWALLELNPYRTAQGTGAFFSESRKRALETCWGGFNIAPWGPGILCQGSARVLQVLKCYWVFNSWGILITKIFSDYCEASSATMQILEETFMSVSNCGGGLTTQSLSWDWS